MNLYRMVTCLAKEIFPVLARITPEIIGYNENAGWQLKMI